MAYSGGLLIVIGIIAAAVDPDFYTWLTARFTNHTVKSRLDIYEQKIDSQLIPIFTEKKVSYPPTKVKLVFFKDETVLKLYAGHSQDKVTLIKSYPVEAASGIAGPKLREGDRQVPEGIYRVESLNPNSRFHLSLRVNYPNSFDQEMAALDQRTQVGSDIMIHGSNVSIGCIAIGNEAIEELFVLAAKTNYQNWELILAPTDLLKNPRPNSENLPKWINDLDNKIKIALKELR